MKRLFSSFLFVSLLAACSDPQGIRTADMGLRVQPSHLVSSGAFLFFIPVPERYEVVAGAGSLAAGSHTLRGYRATAVQIHAEHWQRLQVWSTSFRTDHDRNGRVSLEEKQRILLQLARQMQEGFLASLDFNLDGELNEQDSKLVERAGDAYSPVTLAATVLDDVPVHGDGSFALDFEAPSLAPLAVITGPPLSEGDGEVSLTSDHRVVYLDRNRNSPILMK